MIPKSHPRYESLLLRDKIVKASKEGYLADSAMIAHGRGEAFDYLIGEKTTYPAKRAMYVAVAALLLSNNPVISVNGNATALACDEIIELAKSVNAKIEINLFYRTDDMVKIITQLYKDHGYKEILGTLDDDIEYLNDIKNNRASASKTGIYSADTISSFFTLSSKSCVNTFNLCFTIPGSILPVSSSTSVPKAVISYNHSSFCL
jgi:4-phosphopantoate--beta-alanine ligase